MNWKEFVERESLSKGQRGLKQGLGEFEHLNRKQNFRLYY